MQRAGGMPTQSRYWYIMKIHRKRQYLGQILAIAARRRLTKIATNQQPWIMTKKFIRWPITFTVIRKQIFKKRKEAVMILLNNMKQILLKQISGPKVQV